MKKGHWMNVHYYLSSTDELIIHVVGIYLAGVVKAFDEAWLMDKAYSAKYFR